MSHTQVQTLSSSLSTTASFKEIHIDKDGLMLQSFQIGIKRVCKALLQFSNCLLEDIMYSEGVPGSLLNNIEICQPIPLSDLNHLSNHPLLFEIIAVKGMINRIYCILSKESCNSLLLKSIIRHDLLSIANLIKHIRERLEEDLVVACRRVINNILLSKFGADFIEINEVLEQLSKLFQERSDKDKDDDFTFLSLANYLERIDKMYSSIIAKTDILNQYFMHTQRTVEDDASLQADKKLLEYIRIRYYVLRVDERRI